VNRLGILFAGQGAQHAGMGVGWTATDPVEAKTLAEASRILGYDVRELLTSSDGRLDETVFAQPAIVVSSLLAFQSLFRSTGLRPDAFAGFSLGEWTALGAALVFDFEHLLKFVQIRAQAMQAAAKAHPGAMAAIVGLSDMQVCDVCAEATKPGSYVIAANFNCPGQIVVSGHADAVVRAADLARAAGAKRVVLLNVSGAFHTGLMHPAAERLALALDSAEPFPASAPVYSNVTAMPYGKDELQRLLPLQITSPVLFEQTIRNMMSSGITHFLEIGPGSALSGFVRKISLDLPVTRLDGPEDLANVKGWLKEHGFSE